MGAEDFPQRRILAAETPEGIAGGLVASGGFDLVVSRNRIQKPDRMLLTVVLRVVKMRIS